MNVMQICDLYINHFWYYMDEKWDTDDYFKESVKKTKI